MHHQRVVDKRDDTHPVMANRAAQRIDMPDSQDEVAPAFGGEPGRWGRGDAGPANDELRRQATAAHAAHFVGVPTVVADHLHAFVRYMLGDGGQEISRSEHFEVAVYFGVEPGAVDHDVSR